VYCSVSSRCSVSSPQQYQYTATHCNTLQLTATQCKTLQQARISDHCSVSSPQQAHLNNIIVKIFASTSRLTNVSSLPHSLHCVAVSCSVLQCSMLQYVAHSCVTVESFLTLPFPTSSLPHSTIYRQDIRLYVKINQCVVFFFDVALFCVPV